MMSKKKLAETKAEVAALLGRLPGRSPRGWLDKEIESARRDRKRDVQTLEALCAGYPERLEEERQEYERALAALIDTVASQQGLASLASHDAKSS